MSQPAVPTTIYQARSILTMNPARPRATHVAVRDGRILGVGGLDELKTWGPAELDRRYADQVLMPGLVEGHCHLPEGGMWKFVYVGYYDRRGRMAGPGPGSRASRRWRRGCAKPRPRCPRTGR